MLRFFCFAAAVAVAPKKMDLFRGSVDVFVRPFFARAVCAVCAVLLLFVAADHDSLQPVVGPFQTIQCRQFFFEWLGWGFERGFEKRKTFCHSPKMETFDPQQRMQTSFDVVWDLRQEL